MLVDSYGGPHSGRVTASHDAYLTSQWFADQGFAVVIVDGRGTPGRGHRLGAGGPWGDLAGPVLDDQVDALHGLADVDDRLDLTRVGIRGWSFGGYLAALAVLERPDVFEAAVAGAPVTDWSLYDTHYTERYLGHPTEHAAATTQRTSLLPRAHRLTRPLLLIHGMADDNVVACSHSAAEPGVTGCRTATLGTAAVGGDPMTPQEVVAENLLLHQLDFLRRSLGTGRSE